MSETRRTKWEHVASALLLVGLAAVSSGCVDRAPVFVPACDEYAPSVYQVQVPGSRMDATLYALSDRGWVNVSALRHGTASGECLAGAGDPVLVDLAALDAEDAAEDARIDKVEQTFYDVVLILLGFAAFVIIACFMVAIAVHVIGHWRRPNRRVK